MGGQASTRINNAARQAYEGRTKAARAEGAARLRAFRRTYGAAAVPTAAQWRRGARVGMQ